MQRRVKKPEMEMIKVMLMEIGCRYLGFYMNAGISGKKIRPSGQMAFKYLVT